MRATKSRPKQSVQRVAKYLILRNGRYTYRKAIPVDVRHAFGGRREDTCALGDVSEARAKTLALVLGEKCSQRITEARRMARGGGKVADIFHRRRQPERGEIEEQVRAWLVAIEERLALAPAPGRSGSKVELGDWSNLDAEVTRVMQAPEGKTPLSTQWIAQWMIEANGWEMPDGGDLREFLEDRVARGQRELAVRRKAELSWGQDQPQPTHRMFAPAEFAKDSGRSRASRSGPVPLMEVLEGYFAEQQPSPATVKKWTIAAQSLIGHLGHDDASRVTPDDVIAWKNALLTPDPRGERPRSQMTVRHGYIGAVKPVFAWAVDNKLIASNPAKGVRVAVPRPTQTRAEKGYTDDEAKIVLLAASAVDSEADPSFLAFACRWLPWLCAYTGARVGEMAQLRREDVAKTSEGIWYLNITPEAGSQKGRTSRQVPLHPHLIEQGFVDAIDRRTGPLFFDPRRRRANSIGNPQHKKVAQRVADWVRSLGITDKKLQPNHGWRHRFITKSRGIIEPDIRRAITGHSAKDQHEEYGNVPLQTSHRALMAYPRYDWADESTPSATSI